MSAILISNCFGLQLVEALDHSMVFSRASCRLQSAILIVQADLSIHMVHIIDRSEETRRTVKVGFVDN